MIHSHCSTASQRAQWVSELLAQEGTYGVVSQMSRSQDVSRQTLYSWKAKGQHALEEALAPKWPQQESQGPMIERAVLTLLIQGHASYRGIQACLKELLGLEVSFGPMRGFVQTQGEPAHASLKHQVAPAALTVTL